MQIAILGFDTEGRSTYEYFAAQNHQLTVLDQNPAVDAPEGVETVLGDNYLDNLDRFDLIVRTAGLPPHMIYERNPELDPSKVTTQINEFFKVCPSKNIIGVTGTKGKGTTSTLITRMLEAAKYDVHLAGNIGVPALDLLANLTADSWAVLELSSFQLSDVKYSPHIGVCLMVVPEHLNWHTDFLDYTSAKAQMFAHQTSEDTAIYCAENDASKAIASSGRGNTLPYYSAPGAQVEATTITIGGFAICDTSELQLRGTHNWQNVCAAVTAAWQVTQDIPAMRAALTSFSGLPHRLEFVAEVDGVKYYDDSFGTTPETAIVALQAFEEQKVIILGGSDKGAFYDELAQAVAASNVRLALLIGDQAAPIQAALDSVGFTSYAAGGNTMTEIVQNAHKSAQQGDVVLLSTGCASFGMFKNYKDRAAQFTAAVLELQNSK